MLQYDYCMINAESENLHDFYDALNVRLMGCLGECSQDFHCEEVWVKDAEDRVVVGKNKMEFLVALAQYETEQISK